MDYTTRWRLKVSGVARVKSEERKVKWEGDEPFNEKKDL